MILSILLFVAFASSLSIKQDLHIVGQAIAKLMDQMSIEHDITFRIVTQSGDHISDKFFAKILSISSSPVDSIKVPNTTKFLYEFGKSYIIITQKGLLNDVIRNKGLYMIFKDLPFTDLNARYATFYGPSMLLNYSITHTMKILLVQVNRETYAILFLIILFKHIEFSNLRESSKNRTRTCNCLIVYNSKNIIYVNLNGR